MFKYFCYDQKNDMIWIKKSDKKAKEEDKNQYMDDLAERLKAIDNDFIE